MFKKIEIHHFKSIERAEIELGNINIFVGTNGSGKSNVIDAIRFLRDAVSSGLDRAVSDRHGIDSIRQWSPTKPYRVHLRVDYERGPEVGTYAVGIDSAKGEFAVATERVYSEAISHTSFFNEETQEQMEGVSHDMLDVERNKSGECRIRTYHVMHDNTDPRNVELFPDLIKHNTYKIEHKEDLLFQAPRFPFPIYVSRRVLSDFQAYSIYPNTLRTPQEPSNEMYLLPEGRNLASVIKRMRKTKQGSEAINQITIAMRALLPNLERISILSVGGYLVPQFHMLETNTKRHIFNVSQMSDGTLRILGLLTALYQQPRPAVIALEEPEQTVNPGILAVLADSIKEVSKRSQVLVTTHSPNLLDFFNPTDVRAVELNGGKTCVGTITPLQMQVVKDRLFSLGELLVSDGLHQ